MKFKCQLCQTLSDLKNHKKHLLTLEHKLKKTVREHILGEIYTPEQIKIIIKQEETLIVPNIEIEQNRIDENQIEINPSHNVALNQDSIFINFIIRQNCWKKCPTSFNILRNTNIIHCPWGHTNGHCIKFVHNRNYFENEKGQRKLHIRQFVEDIKIGDVVCVVESDNPKLLLVRVKSDIKVGKIENIKIIYENKKCNHEIYSDECIKCHKDIKEVKYCLNERDSYHCHTKEFYTLYRDIEIITEIGRYQFEELVEKIKYFRNSLRKIDLNINL